MASFFVDWDGTICHAGTTRFLPGVVDHLRWFLSLGHQVFVTTARVNVASAIEALNRVGLHDVVVIPGVQNPRVVINDMGAWAVNHPADTPWLYWEMGELPLQDIGS